MTKDNCLLCWVKLLVNSWTPLLKSFKTNTTEGVSSLALLDITARVPLQTSSVLMHVIFLSAVHRVPPLEHGTENGLLGSNKQVIFRYLTANKSHASRISQIIASSGRSLQIYWFSQKVKFLGYGRGRWIPAKGKKPEAGDRRNVVFIWLSDIYVLRIFRFSCFYSVHCQLLSQLHNCHTLYAGPGQPKIIHSTSQRVIRLITDHMPKVI